MPADGLPMMGAGGGGGPPPPGAPAMGGMSPAVLQQLAQRQGGTMGPTPGTAPVPNAGQHVAGLAIIGKIVKGMEIAVPLVGSQSEAGQALLKCLASLGKFIHQEDTSPGVEKTEQDRMQLLQRQMGPGAAAQQAAGPPGV